MKMTFNDNQLLETLKTRFGFPQFRPGQLEAITSLFNEGSLLCIHPTGFGKSLLYQLPASLLPGMTLVISPLLALMRDQEKQLKTRFGIAAAAINSDQTEDENAVIRLKILKGEIRILFVAPEQLDHVDRFKFLLGLSVDLLVVDEAHCISAWGHDFRPSYRQIIRFVHAMQKKNGNLMILGLTATADSRTEQDIRVQLTSPERSVKVLRESMDRPNISLSVMSVASAAEKLLVCEQLLNQLEGCGLIYCATRENCEIVADYLRMRGIKAEAYHAGFSSEQKLKMQASLLADEYKVVASTNALGMGIDKPNLRFIIHYDIPGSITAYYQEVGRSGRDGLPSRGILLFDPADKKIQRHFIESAQPSQEDFTKVLDAVEQALEMPNLTAIKRTTGLHPTKTLVVLTELVEQDLLTKSSIRGLQVYAKTRKEGVPDLSRYTTQYSVKMRELDRMMHYAEQRGECRMKLLRQALGDEKSQNCGRCDVCCPKTAPSFDFNRMNEVSTWLTQQGVEIAPSKTLEISSGRSLLDGRLRTQLFVHFMRNRAIEEAKIPEELETVIRKHLDKLRAQNLIAGVIAIPSRTWKRREAFLNLISEHLNVPGFSDLLQWKEMPLSRQGELLNNDQRLHNVQYKMTLSSHPRISKGTLILFDDYIGSGHTLKEAARVLRKEWRVENPLIPFTVAFVKWRLGNRGMI